LNEISADKGYGSVKNYKAVQRHDATPYIACKSIHTGKATGLWQRMYHLWQFHGAEFLQHYHKRSNVESTFSMIKAKFLAGAGTDGNVAKATLSDFGDETRSQCDTKRSGSFVSSSAIELSAPNSRRSLPYEGQRRISDATAPAPGDACPSLECSRCRGSYALPRNPSPTCHAKKQSPVGSNGCRCLPSGSQRRVSDATAPARSGFDRGHRGDRRQRN
jgi:hypothetical protein